MKTLLLLLAAILAMGVAAEAQAGLITYIQQAPDITTYYPAVAYNAGTMMFTATSAGLDFFNNNTITGGAYMVSATITNSGVVTSGSLNITGTYGSYGSTGNPLLTGTLTHVYSMDPPGGNQFQLMFDVTGGDMASLFGSNVMSLLYAGTTGFNGTFGSSFNNTGHTTSATIDTFSVPGTPIPEPATVVLMLTGGAWMAWHRRRHNKSAVR
jgi:hypothetical protein